APSSDLIQAFDAAQRYALMNLSTIELSIDDSQAATITALQHQVTTLKTTFDLLVTKQQELGYTETEGLRGALHRAGNAVETIINQNMSWIADSDSQKLLMALMVMR